MNQSDSEPIEGSGNGIRDRHDPYADLMQAEAIWASSSNVPLKLSVSSSSAALGRLVSGGNSTSVASGA